MKIQSILVVVTGLSLAGLSFAKAEDKPEGPGKSGKPQMCKMQKSGPGGHHGFGGPGGKSCDGPGRGMMMGHMLKLTPEQQEKVKAIMEAQKPKIDAIRKEERAKMKAVFEEAEKEIRPLLTPEQVAVLDNAKELRQSQEALKATSKEKKD